MKETNAEVVCIASTVDNLVQTLCCSETGWASADDEDVDFSGDGVSEFLPSIWNDWLHDGRNDMAKFKMDWMKIQEEFTHVCVDITMLTGFTCNGRSTSKYLGCSFSL